MEEKKGVYWHQGMFLQPQHFQLADQYHQFRHTPLFEAGMPHFWGVGALELSRAGIVNRTIEIGHARLLFTDHQYVEFPENTVITPRTFDAAWVEGDKPLTVYLGMRKLSQQEKNVTEVASIAEAGTASTRYATLLDAQEVPDVYSDGPTAAVRTLLNVVKIFFESELSNLDGYELIPIARLVRDGDAVVLSDTFIPPSYAIAGSEPLQGVLKEIRDELAGRTRQLQEYKSPREMQKAEFDASYTVFLLALRSLNRFSPQLFHLLEAGQVHPWHAYGLLRQLVGELSSFSERFNMLGEASDGSAGMPPYDHTDLSRCFGRARVLIGFLLNEITVGPEFLVVLEPSEDLLVGQLPRNFFGQRNRFYLVVRTEQDPEWVIGSVAGNARLAAQSEVPTLLRHALPGLELIHLPVAPQGLPRRSYSYYFRIEQISQQWDAVEREGDIALHWLDAPDDLRAEVVVLRR